MVSPTIMELHLCFYFLQWNKVDKNQHDVPTETRAGLNGFLDSDYRTVRVQSVVGPEGQPGLSVNVTVYRSTLHNHEYQTSPTWFAVCFLFSKFVTTGEEWTFDRSLNQKLYLPPQLTLHLPWFTSKTLRHLTPRIMKVPSSFYMETEPKWWGGGLRCRWWTSEGRWDQEETLRLFPSNFIIFSWSRLSQWC